MALAENVRKSLPDCLALRADKLARAERIACNMAEAGATIATVHKVNTQFLVWSIDEIVWLRSKCRIAVTAIGACSAKVATRGKAAAVPVLLTDEDLYTCIVNGWVRVVDPSGTPVDAHSALEDSLAALPSPAARERQWLRRAVHADLTSKGYALTNGIKFGVDFLAYKGDPTSVHAAFMVIVGREGQGISTLDLVARSRVATTALKMAVMAWARLPSPSDPAGGRPPVTYAVFKRMGPGTAIFADSAAQRAGQAEFEAGLLQHQRELEATAAAASRAGEGGDGLHVREPGGIQGPDGGAQSEQASGMAEG